MALKVTTIIPARLGSKRFPDKVIYPLSGQPLLFYIINELKKSKLIDHLVVATDSKEIAAVADNLDTEVHFTSKKHKTGTDRIVEILPKLPGSVFVNFQADNFGFKASALDRIIAQFIADPKEQFATIVHKIKNDEDLFNPNVVKAITDKNDHALWFSRYPLPYLQNADEKKRSEQFKFLGHVGVYLFRKAGLKKYGSWGRGQFEKAESLEQLRILENGASIKVYNTTARTISVDSPEDLKKLKKIYR